MILITNYISMIIFILISGLGFIFCSPLMLSMPVFGSIAFGFIVLKPMFGREIKMVLKILNEYEGC